MRFRSTLFMTIAACAMALTVSGAKAGPPGWECSYATFPFLRSRSKIYYSCTGTSLSETRARARAQCRRLNHCALGACIPLNFSPRRSCGKE